MTKLSKLADNIFKLFETDTVPQTKDKPSESMAFVYVKTPQHAPHPDENHYAFNFANDGWVFNPEKGCYEIFMVQSGLIDKQTWIFYSLETAKGAHGILFGTKEGFEEFVVYNV